MTWSRAAKKEFMGEGDFMNIDGSAWN